MRPRPRGPVPPQGCGPHARRAQAGRNTGPRHLPVQVSAAPAAPEQPPAISTVFWPGFVPSRHQPAHRPSAALQAAPPPVLRAASGPRSRSPPPGQPPPAISAEGTAPPPDAPARRFPAVPGPEAGRRVPGTHRAPAPGDAKWLRGRTGRRGTPSRIPLTGWPAARGAGRRRRPAARRPSGTASSSTTSRSPAPPWCRPPPRPPAGRRPARPHRARAAAPRAPRTSPAIGCGCGSSPPRRSEAPPARLPTACCARAPHPPLLSVRPGPAQPCPAGRLRRLPAPSRPRGAAARGWWRCAERPEGGTRRPERGDESARPSPDPRLRVGGLLTAL